MISRRPTAAFALCAAITALTACSSGPGSAPGSPSARAATHATVSSTAPAIAPTSPAPSTTSPQQVRARISAELRSITAKEPGGAVSVAAENTVTGEQFTAGRTSGMWTASAYKLLCLSALLLHTSPSSLSSSETASAEAAIEHSDNAAGYQLFLDAGGRSGLQSAIRELGMSHTVAGGSDPTFTTTSGSDYLKLLEAITGTRTRDPLGRLARSYILKLMAQVESDQRWGVGSAADKGSTFYNKNGWLSIADGNGPGENDGGLWAVTSVGVVTVKGQRVLMAVFTRHQPDFATGVTLVDSLSTLIAPAVAR